MLSSGTSPAGGVETESSPESEPAVAVSSRRTKTETPQPWQVRATPSPGISEASSRFACPQAEQLNSRKFATSLLWRQCRELAFLVARRYFEQATVELIVTHALYLLLGRHLPV